MIGLDAADATLIERLCEEGRLPAIQSLRQQGCFGRLESDATIFAGGVWPTFYTSRRVPWHGIYHNRIWRQEHMRSEPVDGAWTSEVPFWEHLGPQGFRTAIVDVPLVRREHRIPSGIHLMGWGAHDQAARGSWPPGLWHDLETAFGPPAIPDEKRQWGAHTAESLTDLRDGLLRTTDQMDRIGEFLLRRNDWDLLLLVLGAPHRGGHYLWDLSQVTPSSLTQRTHQLLEPALIEIYQACDAVVGRLAAASEGMRICVFAVHGMGPNAGWEDRCAEILARIQQARHEVPRRSPLYTHVSRRILRSLKHQAIKRLPAVLQERLFSVPRLRELDWHSIRYFPLPMDHAGYVRVNLRGRERQGIVQPGGEYTALCQELSDAFLSFRDLETNEQIVAQVYQLDDLAPPQAPYRSLLPDLVVVWGTRSATQSRVIRSSRYGEIRWKDGMLGSARSGNHREGAWFVAVGPGITPHSNAHGHNIIDIAPTLFKWLGAEPPPEFQGTSIPALLPE